MEGIPGSRLKVAAGCEERWTPDLSQTKRDRYWETIPIQPLGDAELQAHKASKFIRWEDGEHVFQGSKDPYGEPPEGAPSWFSKPESHRGAYRRNTTNKLVSWNKGHTLAAKTGFTFTADGCYSTVMEVDGRRIAMTILGSPS